MKMSPLGSLFLILILSKLIFAPCFFSKLKNPVLVVFKPTFLIFKIEPLFNIVNAVKKAADDGSPGISKLNEFNLSNYEDNSKREFTLTDEQKRIAYQTVGPVYDWAANYFDRLPPRWTSHHYRYGGIMS